MLSGASGDTVAAKVIGWPKIAAVAEATTDVSVDPGRTVTERLRRDKAQQIPRVLDEPDIAVGPTAIPNALSDVWPVYWVIWPVVGSNRPTALAPVR